MSEQHPQPPAPPPRKSFSEAELDLPASIGTATVALDRLEAMLAARARFGDKTDHEAMHDFRVELRRLRTLLRAYRDSLGEAGSNQHRRALRRIARATDQSRDLEVQLAALALVEKGLRPRDQTGLRWLVRRLERQRAEAEKAGERRIAKQLPPLAKRLGAALSERIETPATGPSLARSTALPLSILIDRMAQQFEQTRTAADQAEAHQVRVAGKRVRYLLEPLAVVLPAAAMLVGRLKGLQDVLGRMHDADVLAGLVAHAAEDAFQEHLARETERMRKGIEPDAATLRNERRRDPLPGLRELARRATALRAEIWAEFERDWLGQREETLLQPLRSLAARLGDRKDPDKEIERKYLLRELPPRATETTPVEIDQGYLPGDRIQERLRRVKNGTQTNWLRTIKFGRGISRDETEEPTTEAVFETMWPLTAGKRVTKRRHKIAEGDQLWEIDEFTDRPLVLAEVELASETAKPAIPEWLRPYVVREVTDEEQYLNINLAR